MNVAQLVPQIALARVVTAGGPYRPGDDLSLAFITPTVSRLVAHDAELRAKCVPVELALVPETIDVVITHCAEPYTSGKILTLSFVDPRVARIHDNLERQTTIVVPKSSREAITLDVAAGELPVEQLGVAAGQLPGKRIAQNATEQQSNGLAAHVEGGSADRRSDFRSGAPASAKTRDEHEASLLRSPAKLTAEIRTGEPFVAETPARPSRDQHQGKSLASPADHAAEIGTSEGLGTKTSAKQSRDEQQGSR